MKSSPPRPNSQPKRSSKSSPSVAPPRRSSGKKPTRTLDLSESAAPKTSKQTRVAPNPNDPGVVRRQRKKVERRRKNAMVTLIFCALSAVVGGTAFGTWQGHKGVWHEYQGMRSKVASKAATLRDLKAQLARSQKRLAEFAHNGGRERALVENGFIRDGDRLLLFPKEK